MSDRRDVFDMLRSLPAVIDLRDMEAFLGMTHAYAKIASSRWAARGLLAPLGRKTGVYFNLVVDPKGTKSRVNEAVNKLLRRPVVSIGASALHDEGWTTQRSYLTELAVLIGGQERTIPKMNGLMAVGRKRGWFQAVLPKCEPGGDGFLVAPPEYALVDMIMADGAGGLWRPDPSDIELPCDLEPVNAMRRIEEAAIALKADMEQVREFISQIEGLDDISPRP